MTHSSPLAASLWTLIVLQAVMLAALFAGVAPHPPRAIALFAMAPFLAASIACAVAALNLKTGFWGKVLSGLAAVMALLSFGPQKYFDPAFPEIWPAVIAAQLAALAIAANLFRPKGIAS